MQGTVFNTEIGTPVRYHRSGTGGQELVLRARMLGKPVASPAGNGYDFI
jgi:hypothetical protein